MKQLIETYRLSSLRRNMGTRILVLVFGGVLSAVAAENLASEPYRLETGLVSRSITFENPTGAPGEGGKAAGPLGSGRKGRPLIQLHPGKEVQLANIEGMGTLRHIWLTTFNNQENLRSLVIRFWWDDQPHPSIESPLGDFFGAMFGLVTGYQSAVHSLGTRAGLNIWLPMPFTRRARITLTNEGREEAVIYYQIDYTLGENHPQDVGRLHALFRRENPTTEKVDFELLPRREGKGRFIGALIGVRAVAPHHWWGEGEMKAYLDGDTDYPTICGTGAEDYVCQSWGLQDLQHLYHGCPFMLGANKPNKPKNVPVIDYTSMYRWHLPDPIFWKTSARITIQQIGNTAGEGLIETADDWSCVSFWYEPIPSEPLPVMPSLAERLRDLPSSKGSGPSVLEADPAGRGEHVETPVATGKTDSPKSAMFTRMDVNTDSRVTVHEFTAVFLPGFAKADRDESGFLIYDEFPFPAFKLANADSDGQVTRDEFEKMYLQQFRAKDENHDGILTHQEFCK